MKLEDLGPEEMEELKNVIERFMGDLGRFAIQNDLEDQYDGLLMFTFETVLENSVPEAEQVKMFSENFDEYVGGLLEAGEITVDEEEELEKRFQEAKQRIKKREGRE